VATSENRAANCEHQYPKKVGGKSGKEKEKKKVVYPSIPLKKLFCSLSEHRAEDEGNKQVLRLAD